MAKFKGYRTYFVGVEKFFFHNFQHKFCEFLDIDSKDTEMDRLLNGINEFTETEFHILYRPGNLSNQFSGKLASVSSVKIFSDHEDMYYNDGCDPWVDIIAARLKYFDYKPEIDNIIAGIDAILSRSAELIAMQSDGMCMGYSREVLLQLKCEIMNVYNSIGAAGKKHYKESMARILLMTLTYFVANGSSFIHLGKDIPVDDNICSAYKTLVPDISTYVPDFDIKLTTDVSYNGEALSLEDAIEKENANIIITGDGGAGKSTMMLSAANNMSANNIPCVFIEAKESDNFSVFDPIKDYLILNRILHVFPEWINRNKTVDPYKLCQKILTDNLGNNKLIIFIDAINEASPASQQTLINQISELLKATNKVKFVASSRYSIPQLKQFKEVKVNRLNPLKYLSADKSAEFNQLSEYDKNIFSTPLYMKIFAESSNAVLKFSVLISKKYQREIEKAEQKAVVDRGVVIDFLCKFTEYLFRNCGGPMIFSLEQLKEYISTNPTVHSYEYIKSQLELVLPLKDSVFSYNHETEKDYLLALFITKQFEKTSSVYETSLTFFCGRNYPKFVLKLLNEMLQNKKNDIFRSLRQKSCGEQFFSDKIAYATATAVEIFKDAKQLRGLNLTKVHLDSPLKNVNFADCIMQPGTLIGNSINSAVFRICSDEKSIYTIGRGRLNVFDHSLCEKESVDFESDTNIVSCRQNHSNIIFTDKSGRCFIFDKQTSAVKPLSTNKAVSVEIFEFFDQSGFLIGLDNGSFAVIDEESLRTETISTYYDSYVIPLNKSDDNEYIYITSFGEIHRFNTETHSAKVLWQLEYLLKDMENPSVFKGIKIKSTLKITDDCYILEFYKPGFTLICEVNIETECYSIIHTLSAGDALDAESSKASYNIDYNKVNDMAFRDGSLFIATNSGFVNVFIKDSCNNWIFKTKNAIDYNLYSRNPGDGVESVCVTDKNILLFGSTTRNLYQVNYSIEKEEFRYTVTDVIKGTNIGIRRIMMSNDGQKLYAFCFNHSVVIYIRNENGQFVFSEKIHTGSGWVWDGCEDENGVLYIACDEKILTYADGKTQLLKEFDTKVEKLFFMSSKGKRKARLFAAVGYRVEEFVLKNGTAVYQGKISIGDENDRYRPISFSLCKSGNARTEEIAVGCSSYKRADETEEPAKIFKIDSNSSSRSFYKKDILQGWFRSVEYDDNNRYYVCAGLKHDGKNVAVVFNHKRILLYVLTGHNNFVSDAKIVKSENDMLYIATAGYDGIVNLYCINIEKDADKKDFSTEFPFKCSGMQNSLLFNIVPDGNDLLVSSISGKVFRWQDCLQTNNLQLAVEAENHNIFVIDSDFSKAKGIDSLKSEIETFNNKL